MVPVRDELAAVIEASDLGNIDERLRKWEASQATPQLAYDLAMPSIMADLAGQLFVRTIEVPDSTRKLADIEITPFLDMPFAQAVEFFRNKFPEDGGEKLDFLLNAYVKRGGRDSRLLLSRLAETARENLTATLQNGGTFQDFANAIREGSAGLGIEPPTHGYIQLVHRTQVQTAYGAGRFKQLTNPAVTEVRPYVEYRTVRDERVRDEHAELDGLQFDARSSAWHDIAPPNGFNCRCGMVSLDESEVDRDMLRDAPPPVQIDFLGPPTGLEE